MQREIKTWGIAGTGVIGAGWAARALSWGLDVVAWDPAPDAEQKLRDAVANAWPALQKMGLAEGASQDRLRFCDSVESMASQADFIQENAPERIELKTALHQQMDAVADAEVIITSSTSGLLPSEFQKTCRHPERILVGHPFNPVYLLPLVEVLGGEKTDPAIVDRAMAIYQSIGMYPLKVRNEIEGFLSDRLQEALWREALHLVNDGVATTEELDAAIAYGPGLRWAMWGTCMIFHLAGGEGGMRHMLKHFDPSMFPWTKLDPPPITDELIDKVATGCEQQAAGRSIRELEQQRDQGLIAIMQALRNHDIGAGNVVHENEARRIKKRHFDIWTEATVIDTQAPLKLYHCTVLPEWVDYNNHMTEAAYLTAFGWASDALFRFIGDDESYRDAGYSFYTVETHINYYLECSTGEPLYFTTQLVALDRKRMQIFHRMYRESDDALLATAEQMLLHVDMNAGAACPILPSIFPALEAINAAHKSLPTPKELGNVMKMKHSL